MPSISQAAVMSQLGLSSGIDATYPKFELPEGSRHEIGSWSYLKDDVEKEKPDDWTEDQWAGRMKTLKNYQKDFEACGTKMDDEVSSKSTGHRGAPLKMPEETEASYMEGAKGALWLECDFVVTKDWKFVCRHDIDDLAKTTDILINEKHEKLRSKCTWFTDEKKETKPKTVSCSTFNFTEEELSTLRGISDQSMNPKHSDRFTDKDTIPLFTVDELFNDIKKVQWAEPKNQGLEKIAAGDEEEFERTKVLTLGEYFALVKKLNRSASIELKRSGNPDVEKYIKAAVNAPPSKAIPKTKPETDPAKYLAELAIEAIEKYGIKENGFRWYNKAEGVEGKGRIQLQTFDPRVAKHVPTYKPDAAGAVVFLWEEAPTRTNPKRPSEERKKECTITEKPNEEGFHFDRAAPECCYQPKGYKFTDCGAQSILKDLHKSGVKIFAPPFGYLLTSDESKNITISVEGQWLKDNLSDAEIVSWSMDRKTNSTGTTLYPQPETPSNDFYLGSTSAATYSPSDNLRIMDVLFRDVGITSLFSDWPHTTNTFVQCVLGGAHSFGVHTIGLLIAFLSF